MISDEKLSDLRALHYKMDPDYIVDVLDISSRELIEAFEDKFIEFCEEEFSNDDEEVETDEEGYND